MAALLFEIWETEDSMECVAVSSQADAVREPNARFVKAFHASTYNESGQAYYDHYDWGRFTSIEGVTDIPFSYEEQAAQSAYLSNRKIRPAKAV